VPQGNTLFLSTKLQRIPKNNAIPRVYPYGVVFNTITQSIVNHSIGVKMEKIDKIIVGASLVGFACLMLIIGIWG
jgi:hypothetical protein